MAITSDLRSSEPHPNARLEAFCDGVFAIAITLLIIEIKVPSEAIGTTRELWSALGHLGPLLSAFFLSFVIIFITWVNHHAFLRLVNKSSSAFIYANGLMLLTVVVMPFPTALAGEYLLTNHAAPAVVVYNSVTAVQALSWILLTGAVLKDRLARDEKAARLVREAQKRGYFAVVVYSLLALIAAWFPISVAIVTTMLWTYWLIVSINLRAD